MAGNPSNINTKGGGKMWVHQVTLSGSTWSLVATPVQYTTGADLGIVKSSKYATNPSETSLFDEANIKIYTDSKTEPLTEAILYERNIELLNFLEFTTVGKFYLQYHYQNIVNGFHIEEFAIGQITAQANGDFPGGDTLAYKFTKLVVEGAQTFAALDINGIQTAYATPLHPYAAGAIVITSGRYLERVKTAV